MKKKKIETWDQIPKIKWTNLPKKEKVTQLFQLNQTLIKSKALIVLENINTRITREIDNGKNIVPIKDIFNIVTSPDILRISYNKIKLNKESITPGSYHSISADSFSEEKIRKLSELLRKKLFQWKPVRRIIIDKPGKLEKQPIGLPDFDDKIVQGAILMTLESAFEPEFGRLGSNFGFRPHKDITDVIEKIRRDGQGHQYVVEGDISKAYDFIQYPILMKIIKRRFTDESFLKLIEDGLKAGYLLEYKFHETLLGIPQGGICSSILFNIYMQEFDKFILFELSNNISKQKDNNKTESNKPLSLNETNQGYEKIKSRIHKNTQRLKDLEKADMNLSSINPEFFCQHVEESNYIKNLLTNNTRYNDALRYYKESNKNDRVRMSNSRQRLKKIVLSILNTQQQLELAQEYHGIITILIKNYQREIMKTNSKLQERFKPSLIYIRYVDNWILFVRGTKEMAEKAKEIAGKFLQEELNFQLSLEKTKITDLYNNKAKFLGYEIFYQKNKKGVNETLQTFGNIQFSPDTQRLENRFLQKKFINKNGTPREVPFLTPLQDHEIITKFNQFIIGLGTYYIRHISYPSKLNRWIYILYFSCIKTLATKHKTTTKSIISKGYLDLSNPDINKKKPSVTDLRIISFYQFDNQEKYSILLNYKETMYKMLKLRKKYRYEKTHKFPHHKVREIDMLTLDKVNFQTALKETTLCAICGCQQETLQKYHIKPLKNKNNLKYTSYKGFDKVVASLEIKQIPVCKTCHQNIHNGKYDKLDLNDLYDIRQVATKGILNYRNNPSTQTQLPLTFEKKKDETVVNKEKQTYINRGLLYYLQITKWQKNNKKI